MRAAVVLVALALAGCVNVRTVPVAAGDPPEALLAHEGRTVVVRVRGEGLVEGRFDGFRADTLLLYDGRMRRALPPGEVCAVTSTAGRRRVSGTGALVGAGIGGALTLGALAELRDTPDCITCGIVLVGSLVSIPVLAGLGAILGGTVTPARRYVFDARCR